MKRLISTSLIISAMSLSNMAQAEEGNYYLKAGLGVGQTVSTSSSNNLTTGSGNIYKFSTDYSPKSFNNFGFSLGLKVNKLYSIEAAYQYSPSFTLQNPISVSLAKQVTVSSFSTSVKEYKAQIETSSFFLNNLFELSELFKINWKAKPYLGLGIGATNYNYKFGYKTTSGSEGEFNSTTGSNLFYKATLGTTFPVSKSLYLDLSYAYSDYGKLKSGTDIPNSTDSFNNSADINLTTNELDLGIRYRF